MFLLSEVDFKNHQIVLKTHENKKRADKCQPSLIQFLSYFQPYFLINGKEI